MEGLKASRAGIDDMARNMPSGASPHPGDGAPHPAGVGESMPPGHEYVDPAGNKSVIGADGYIRDEHGNVVPDTEPVREPHKSDLPNVHEHETAPVKEEPKVLEGAGGPGRVENGTGHPAGGSRPTSMHSGDGAHPAVQVVRTTRHPCGPPGRWSSAARTGPPSPPCA